MKYDIDLETAMLSEEANEFFTSETLVDRLDAWADFAFVSIGTAMKYMAVEHKDFQRLEDYKEEFEILCEYISTTQAQMGAVLLEELTSIDPSLFYEDADGETQYDELMYNILNIVIAANEQKGFELNAEGKVQKPEGFVKPEASIDRLLCKTLGQKYRSVFN